MDITTIFLIIALIVVAVMIMQRLGNNAERMNSPTSTRGRERPRYDDPDIESRGTFGRSKRGGEDRRYDSQNVESRGGFGRSAEQSEPRERSYDDDDISSRGGFGRNK